MGNNNNNIHQRLYDFHKLDKENKFMLIKTHGKFLMERIFAGRKVILFELMGFFCEVWSSSEWDQVSNIIPFTTTKCLKPYLEIINIDDALTA